jgi:cyclomaltodextrinase
MKNRFLRTAYLVAVISIAFGARQSALAMTVTLTPAGRTVVVWAQNQTISGSISAPVAASGILYVNGSPLSFSITDTVFSVPIRIGEGTTTIVARVDSSGIPMYSDSLALILGYNVRPEILASATVSGNTVTLHGSVLENPDSSLLSFSWSQRVSNPCPVTLQGSSDSTASFTAGAGLPGGEYYFDLTVVSSHGDTVRPATIVTLDSLGAHAFDIAKDHARWIDSSILYSVAVHLFMPEGRLADITSEIPELADLGVNTIWLLPVFPTTEPNLGYHVLDYFKIRSDFGTDQDLHTLVAAAHARGMRVMLDLVPNHTTIYHPYAQDAIIYGQRSHYYDFYSHSGPGVVKTVGLMQFTIYFYPELVNLNFGNPELARMMIEAGRYWIEKFDIDGYRLDMVWAVDDRFPDYMRTWSLAMKRTKPDVFLLAEAFADTAASSYPLPKDERYDAAFDWASLGRPSWVGPLGNATAPAELMRQLVGKMNVPGGRVLRMLENNDIARFLVSHTLPQLRMAAALLFTIHGIPMLFMAQEIGSTIHPYSGVPVLERGASVHEQDRLGLWAFYQALARLRILYPLFLSDNYEALNASPSSTTYAYHRWEGDHHAFCILNMRNSSGPSTVTVPGENLHLDMSRTYYLTDMMTGEVFPVTASTLPSLTLNFNPWSARVLLLDTVAAVTTVPGERTGQQLPNDIALEQNYPNPFNPSTTFEYDIPGQMSVNLRILDVLGRNVATLVDGVCSPGRHAVYFDGSNLASGPYFYVLRAGSRTIVKKMLLIR